MDWQQWAKHWNKLARQEDELGTAREGAGASAAHPDAGLRTQRDGASVQHIRAQLARHLSAASALLATGGPLAGQALERRQQQCTAAQAAWQATCDAQLEELAQAEVELAAEYDEATLQVQQLLAPTRSDGTHASSARAAQQAGAAAAAPGADCLPPEVAAHDAFQQRHGPTGGLMPQHPHWEDCRLALPHGSGMLVGCPAPHLELTSDLLGGCGLATCRRVAPRRPCRV